MLNRGLKGLLAALAGMAMLALAGCSTPCGGAGRLCAPIGSNTSTPLHPRAGLPAPQQVEAVREQTLRVEPAQAQTMPVAPPEAINHNSSNSNIRIALLLPLRSNALGAPAGALRAGFMAAYGRDPAGFTVNLVETGDSTQDTLDAYASALAHNDLVVGPLARSAVSALAASTLVRKPTIALNHPETRIRALPGTLPMPLTLPPQMLVMGLSIEDEARQVADWAAAEHPGGAAMIVSGSSAWQRRIAASFAARWRELGQPSQLVELSESTGILGDAALDKVRNQADAQAPALLFAALDAGQAGQVRGALGADLPLYGTSSVNPGARPGAQPDADPDSSLDAGVAQLDGLRLLDLPWEVQPEHQAVMVYPRWTSSARTLDMDRLYALGIDAFRVARELALRPGANFQLDGVTGHLSVSFGASDGAARFERVQPAAIYQGGAFTLVPLVPLVPLPPPVPPLPERR